MRHYVRRHLETECTLWQMLDKLIAACSQLRGYAVVCEGWAPRSIGRKRQSWVVDVARESQPAEPARAEALRRISTGSTNVFISGCRCPAGGPGAGRLWLPRPAAHGGVCGRAALPLTLHTQCQGIVVLAGLSQQQVPTGRRFAEPRKIARHCRHLQEK